jgi:hypothetical protein
VSTIRVSDWVGRFLGGICARGLCGRVRWPSNVGCILNPEDCYRRALEDPVKDPIEEAIDIAETFEGALVAPLAGTTVKETTGVRIRRAKIGQTQLLTSGMTLGVGDWLLLSRGNKLALDDRGNVLQTPPSGVATNKATNETGWAVYVSAPPPKTPEAPAVDPQVLKSNVKRALTERWAIWGAAGQPRATSPNADVQWQLEEFKAKK